MLSQRFHDNRRNVPSCLSARQENREQEEEEAAAAAAERDGEDTLRLECVYKTHTFTHLCMRNNPAGMHEALQIAKTHRVTVTGVTGIRAHYQEHYQHATES